MKVEQFYNKNQFIIRNKGEIWFQSYDSTIAKVDIKGNLTLFNNWDYSNTTRKHLYLFMYDFCYGVYNLIKDSKNKCKQVQKLIDLNKISYEL